jgi:AcrR family transcriptional regulator
LITHFFTMNKKDSILKIALELFSNQGYENTSTSLIAKKAAVSEGLIFRHFTNKEGLLTEIMNEGIIKIQPFLDTVINEKDAEKVILKVIELPYKIILSEKEFWKLQINIKSQNSKFKKDFDTNKYLIPVYLKLNQAFSDLKFENPELETQYLFTLLNGLTLSLIELENLNDAKVIINYIQSKYKK